MTTGHHLFAPSGAHRWMVCAPALAVGRSYPRQSSYDAAEGTLAHDLASTCLQLSLDAHEAWQSVEVASVEGHDIPVTAEMRAYVQQYLDYVRGLNGGMEVEQRIEFAAEPDFGGTADALVWDLATATLHVIDFKFGKGVRVSAENNKQMMSYALLAISRPDVMMDVERVVLHVHQPRIDNVSEWEMPVGDLVTFAKEISQAIGRSRNAIKWMDSGQAFSAQHFRPGDHCKFCPHAARCIGLQEQSIVSAQDVFGDVTKVPASNIADILSKADMIDAWIAAVRKEAMDRALKGETLPGYKLVQKRAMRKWTDPVQVEAVALDNLIEVHERVLMTPPALEKAIGKEVLAATFGGLVQSVSSGLTLVAADDKRAAVDPATAAAEKAAGVFSAVE